MSEPLPLPFIEGCLAYGRGDAAALHGGGRQVLQGAHDGVQVIAFGRFEIRGGEAGPDPVAALATAWRRHGANLPAQLSGDFLVAVWEPARRLGVVAVDRFSTYSLFWGMCDGRLAFATRPARVCALLGHAEELDPRAVHAYLYFHVVPAPLSIFRGVRRLDVGGMLAVGPGGCEECTHWVPEFDERRPFRFDVEREAFMSALREGVRETTAGVPRDALGCFLSGGTDSSTVSGLVTEAYGAPARTFSIGFDVSGYDERRYSRLAVARFGTEHTEHVLTPDEAEAALDVVASSYEQPFGNSSAVPTYVCARLAREAGVRRMLGGDGGDELYGGNERYARQWIFSLYGVLPGPLRAGLMEPLLLGPLKDSSFWPVRKARGYVEQARVPLPDRLGAKYNLLNRFGPENVLSAGVLREAAGFEPADLEREVWARCAAPSQINRLLAYDFKFTLGDNDLPKVTRMCHAAGTEVAFPMLADAVTDHSLRLAPEQKLRRTHLRYFFREALRGFLPDEIIDKPKHGFGMPFGDWVLSQPKLAARAHDALAALAGRGLIRPGFLDELDRTVRGGHAGYYGTMTWVLMMLELWLRHAGSAAGAGSGSGPAGRSAGPREPMETGAA